MAELLADIWPLGSWPEAIVDMLRSRELPPASTEVLDLGCGKGAVTLPIAMQLGFKVRGVDLFAPFIEEARARASQHGVADLCRYEVGDMRALIDKGATYDVVILASVGGILGDFGESVAQLRRACRSRGYMVIDDGFLARASRLDQTGYEHYRSHDETIRQLTSHGDVLLQETIVPVAELRAYNLSNTALIRARANRLALRHPEMAAALARYVQWEEAESEILETETIPAIWLLQRH